MSKIPNHSQKQRRKKQKTSHNGTLFQRFYESRPAMMIASVAIAIVLWFVISIAIYPTTPRTINHIPLQVEIAGTSAEENGLSVIDYDVEEVTVQIEGNRSKVGNIEADDLTATAVIENVTAAGTKTLSITVTGNGSEQFNVKSISPSKVDVTFDRIDTYTFEVRPAVPNITYADGCVLDEENFVSNPGTIAVTGPQQQLNQVAYCVAETQQKEQLSASKILTTDTLLFYNEAGTQVDSSNFTYDVATFSIEVPVLYQKTMDITYQITNAPANFDLDSLNLSLSENQITLAAPNTSLDEMNEFNIGSISLRDIDLNYSNDFVVTVPDDYVNQSGFSTVTLTLDSTGLAKKDFVLSDIGIINAPASYDFEVLTQQLTVSIIGPEEIIADLDASDITANVDLLSYSTQAEAVDGDTVTFNYTPTISCARYNTVWAVGDYRVAVKGVRNVGTTASVTPQNKTITEATSSE
ncbi:MAG: YbbR-like domain-containing protein [Ruminococcus sp.]